MCLLKYLILQAPICPETPVFILIHATEPEILLSILIPHVLPPRQSLVPTLPTMQLERQQLGQGFRCVSGERSLERLLSSRDKQ